MTSHFEYNPQTIFDALEKAAEEWAEAKYKYYLLEKAGDLILAQQIKKARREDTPATVAKDIAKASAEMQVHYKGEAEALRNELRARLRYQNYQVLASARQTEESSRRALTR